MITSFLFAAFVGACPLPDWQPPCAPMTEVQKTRVRDALEAHTRNTSECAQLKEAAHVWLADLPSLAWTYTSHAGDRTGKIVGGQTIKTHTRKGVGLRAETLRWSHLDLARVVLHEAAHLRGANEETAQRFEGCAK